MSEIKQHLWSKKRSNSRIFKIFLDISSTLKLLLSYYKRSGLSNGWKKPASTTSSMDSNTTQSYLFKWSFWFTTLFIKQKYRNGEMKRLAVDACSVMSSSPSWWSFTEATHFGYAARQALERFLIFLFFFVNLNWPFR